MEKHITILGAFYIAFSAQAVLAAIIVFGILVGGGLLSGDMEAIRITSSVGSALAFFLLLVSIPGIICGIGLLKRQAWARILGLILSFLNLLHLPLGTILGIYGIWVLMQDETAQIFADESRPESTPPA